MDAGRRHAHQQRRAVVGRHRAHGDAELAVAEEEIEGRHDGEQRDDGRDLRAAQADAGDLHDVPAHAQIERMRIGVPIVMSERRMTASATVTSTVEKIGSPSIGRVTKRSMSRPNSMAKTMAPAMTTKGLPVSVVEIVHAT